MSKSSKEKGGVITSTEIDVTRRQGGAKNWFGRDFHTQKLESSDGRRMRQTLRYWENWLHPKATLEQNISEILYHMFASMASAYIIYNLIVYTPLWHLGVFLALVIFGFGLYFSIIAFMRVPYSRLFLLLRGAVLCLGLVILFI